MQRPPVAAAPLRVLVVDDNPDAAGTMAGLLILAGHHARYFVDGPTALAAAPAFRPDVCLLDLRMPGMDGCELGRQLRSALGDRLKLVAVTGERREVAEPRVAAARFDLWFSKPADPTALLAALQRISAPADDGLES